MSEAFRYALVGVASVIFLIVALYAGTYMTSPAGQFANRISIGGGGPSDRCTTPTDGMLITTDTTFCNGVYQLPHGVTVIADGKSLNCNGATLVGDSSNQGITVDAQNANVRNCVITGYVAGIFIRGDNALIQNIKAFGNTYGGYVFSWASNTFVRRSDFSQNIQTGFVSYGVGTKVESSRINYNGWRGAYISGAQIGRFNDNEVCGNVPIDLLCGNGGVSGSGNMCDYLECWQFLHS